MKKSLVVLMAAMIMSMGAANAATSSTPISDWLNSVTSKITRTEQNTASQIEARKQEAEARKAEQKRLVAERKAERERLAAQRKAEAAAAKKQLNAAVNEQKTFWKKLFTWDWD